MNKKSQKYIHSINLKQKEMIDISKDFFNKIKTRRTIRDFSSKDIPEEILENAIQAAGRAPSGANQQPWHFVIVGNKKIKKSIRNAAEKEEQTFYTTRAPSEWFNALSIQAQMLINHI